MSSVKFNDSNSNSKTMTATIIVVTAAKGIICIFNNCNFYEMLCQTASDLGTI